VSKYWNPDKALKTNNSSKIDVGCRAHTGDLIMPNLQANTGSQEFAVEREMVFIIGLEKYCPKGYAPGSKI
jgi:hypothetical protein